MVIKQGDIFWVGILSARRIREILDGIKWVTEPREVE